MSSWGGDERYREQPRMQRAKPKESKRFAEAETWELDPALYERAVSKYEQQEDKKIEQQIIAEREIHKKFGELKTMALDLYSECDHRRRENLWSRKFTIASTLVGFGLSRTADTTVAGALMKVLVFGLFGHFIDNTQTHHFCMKQQETMLRSLRDEMELSMAEHGLNYVHMQDNEDSEDE